MHIRRIRLLPLIALLFALSPIALAQDDVATVGGWMVDSEHWYVLEINGAHAGWQSTLIETDGERWRTTIASAMSISRGAATVSIESRSSMVETDDGEPVSMRSEQKLATETSVTRWEFDGDEVRQIVESNGREIVTTQALPDKPWVTPMAADRYWRKKADEGASTIFARVLTPENGLTPADVTYERQGVVDAEYRGQTVEATAWKTTSSVLPDIAAIEQYASDGALIHSVAELPFGTVVTRLATKQVALAETGPGPEIMVSSFVPLAEPIRNAMRSTRATFAIRATDGREFDIPSAGAQQAERDGDGIIVRVNVNQPRAATDEEQDDPVYLQASGAIDHEDSLIRKLADNATRRIDDDNPAAKAKALHRLVNRHISRKGMTTAFADASETARTRTGDCSEHAVLHAAVLRAEGIPSRVATGLVYVDRFEGNRNVFGWHMWTQALIDEKWIDLDATLPVPYHAGHVLTGVSALEDGSPASEMNAILTLIGNLEIELVDVEYD